MAQRIALAYSGGLDTSAIIPWLIEQYDGEVFAIVGDVGQGEDELIGIEQKARRSGAADCTIVDLKDEFIDQYAYPALMAGAIYEGRYLLGTAIARPILAKAQVAYAREVGADALAHGCTGKGNDQVRFESAFAALAPDLEVIAPWRIWNLQSREDLLAYLRRRDIPTTASVEKIYSRDANLWHISHEGGELEDPWQAPPEHVWTRTVSPEEAPGDPEDVRLTFHAGRPVAMNGEALGPAALVEMLNEMAGRHGVGRVDLVENRLVGMKSRGCYETPGGSVLHEALHSLAQITLDRTSMQLREQLGARLAELLYNGAWFTPAREAIAAAIESIAQRLTGEVVVRLYRGRAMAVARRSPKSLYTEAYATFSADAVYDQSHAEGFIRLHSLPSRIAAMKRDGEREDVASPAVSVGGGDVVRAPELIGEGRVD